MASSRIIEEESGTYYARPRHPHNGYYAGDFSGQPLRLLTYRALQSDSTAWCRHSQHVRTLVAVSNICLAFTLSVAIRHSVVV